MTLLFLFSGMVIVYRFTLFSFKPPYIFVTVSVFVFVLLGMINMERIKPGHGNFHYSKTYQKGNTIGIKIKEALKHSSFYHRYIGEVRHVEGHTTEGKIMLRISKKIHPEPLNLNHLIITDETLEEIHPPLNPGAFDFKAYAKRKNIFHQLDLKKNNFLKEISVENSLKIKALQVREKLIRSLARNHFSKDEFSVITALLLGKRQDLSKEIVDDYKDSGAMHILAISGLHIGILLIILNFIFKPITYLKHGKMIRMILLLLCLWSFAFITGLSASVIRAVSMFTALTLGMFSNRSSNISNYLFLSMFILLWVNPLYLFDVGFQLSYASVLAILWLGPLLKGFWNPKNKILSYFWNLIVISVAAQIGVLPISLFYFHQFSGLFFVSSLLIIPFLGIILGGGFLILILDQLNEIPVILIDFYNGIIGFMNGLMGFLSGHKRLVLENVPFPFIFIVLTYGLIFCLEGYLKKRTARKFIYLLNSMLLLQVGLVYEKRKTQMSSDFMVMHHAMHTTLVHRKGDVLKTLSTMMAEDSELSGLIQPYQQQYYQVKVEFDSTMVNLLRAGEKDVLIVDEAYNFKALEFNPDIVLLRNSPKINLDRLLTLIQPEIVISDGSNYSSYSKRWKKSCKKQGINFHNTFLNGAFASSYAP